MKHPKICLNMIVRDEEACIQKCLDSAKPWITSYAILDTGSGDNTPQIIRDFPIAGVLASTRWENDFALARNEALTLTEEADAEWILFLDADDPMEIPETGEFPDLSSYDAILLKQIEEGIATWRIRMVRRGAGFQWEGPLHEYLVHPEMERLLKDGRMLRLNGPVIRVNHNGAASRDPEAKFMRDIGILLDMQMQDPGNSRTVYYMGQTYRNHGDWDAAVRAYSRYLKMDKGHPEERWYAQYCVGRCREAMGDPPCSILSAYKKAYKMRPERIEPCVSASMYLRSREDYKRAYEWSQKAFAVPIPPHETICVFEEFYTWIAAEQHVMNCLDSGREEEAVRAMELALAQPGLPEDCRRRFQNNLKTLEEAGRITPESVIASLRDKLKNYKGEIYWETHKIAKGIVFTDSARLSLPIRFEAQSMTGMMGTEMIQEIRRKGAEWLAEQIPATKGWEIRDIRS